MTETAMLRFAIHSLLPIFLCPFRATMAVLCASILLICRNDAYRTYLATISSPSVAEGKDILPPKHNSASTSFYISAEFGSQKRKTKTIKNSLEPNWGETFDLYVLRKVPISLQHRFPTYFFFFLSLFHFFFFPFLFLSFFFFFPLSFHSHPFPC
jgi:hypothetical protein